jgi:hypothetical protein
MGYLSTFRSTLFDREEVAAASLSTVARRTQKRTSMTIIAAACYGDGVIFAGDSHPSHMLPTAFEGQRHAVPPARKVFSNKARGFAIGMAGLPDLGGIRPDGRRIEAVNLYGLIWSKLTLTDPDDLGESPVMDCLEIFGAAARCLKSNANPVDLLIGCANYRQEPILLNYSMSPPRWEPAEGVSSSPVAGCGLLRLLQEADDIRRYEGRCRISGTCQSRTLNCRRSIPVPRRPLEELQSFSKVFGIACQPKSRRIATL